MHLGDGARSYGAGDTLPKEKQRLAKGMEIILAGPAVLRFLYGDSTLEHLIEHCTVPAGTPPVAESARLQLLFSNS